MRSDFPKSFDAQPALENDLLVLRPLEEQDSTALTKAASDPSIWAGHPNKDRHQKEVFDQYFSFLLGMGGSLLIRDKVRNDVIGCSAFYTDTNSLSRLSIGFTFLTRSYWGGATNRILKKLMLDHIYKHSSEAWFHIAPSNLRSQAATKKLGAVWTHDDIIDLGGGEQRWKCYCLTREAWEKMKQKP